jgi:hypothetical protein
MLDKRTATNVFLWSLADCQIDGRVNSGSPNGARVSLRPYGWWHADAASVTPEGGKKPFHAKNHRPDFLPLANFTDFYNQNFLGIQTLQPFAAFCPMPDFSFPRIRTTGMASKIGQKPYPVGVGVRP